MKKIFTLLLISASFYLVGQNSFSDDFESYNVGDYIAQSSSDWATWGNNPGTDGDAQVSDEQAASGTKSLKIYASNPDGGPMDILLPFKGAYQTGHLIQTMKLYIAEGNNAYFNYQATQTPGTAWTINGFFRDGGRFDLTNGANAIVFSTTYTQGEWIELTLDVNMTNNLWKVLLNGECVGAFKNNSQRVASMNLYPTDINSTFYVDDVSFTYTATAPSLDDDISVSNISNEGRQFADSPNTFSYLLSNNGKNVINDVEMNIRVNGLLKKQNLTGLNLQPGESVTVDYDKDVNLIAGENNFEFSVSSVNGKSGDDEDCNNMATYSLPAAKPAQYKATIVEEGTGTWCPWCVRGTVYMDRLSHKYEGYYIPIAVHNNDPMEIAEYDSFITSWPNFGGFPNVVVARNDADGFGPISDIENPFLADIEIATEATLEVGVKVDPTTNDMEATVYVTFVEDYTNDVHVNLVFTEDGVTGTGSGYNQANAYANGTNGPMGGYENLPVSVPASQMVYDHVARIALGLQANANNTLKGPFKKGDTRVVNFTTSLSTDFNTDNMFVIPILNDGRKFINAIETTFDDAIAKGISNVIESSVLNTVKVYPNPANTVVNVELFLENSSNIVLEIFDVTGTTVRKLDLGNQNGNFVIPVDISAFDAGTYISRIITDDGIAVNKFNVVK